MGGAFGSVFGPKKPQENPLPKYFVRIAIFCGAPSLRSRNWRTIFYEPH